MASPPTLSVNSNNTTDVSDTVLPKHAHEKAKTKPVWLFVVCPNNPIRS